MNNIPRIVYKYRTWSDPNHKRILTNNELYLASPADFNDPFDCRIPPDFTSLDTKEKISLFVNKRKETHFDSLVNKGKNIDNALKALEKNLNEDIWGYQLNFEDSWFSHRDEYVGVLTMSARWDSILMWSHYSDKHKGFCVGFYEEKLREIPFVSRAGLVSYDPADSFPFIDPLGDYDINRLFTETHTKAKDWSYEKEYRLIRIFPDNPPTKEDRKVNIKNNFFAEVILGLNMQKEHKNEIISICREKQVKVFQIEKVPFYFGVRRKPVPF